MTMKRGLALVLCLLLLAPVVSAEVSGVNKNLDIEGTPIAAISTPSQSSDGVEFEITVTLDENAANNGTSVSWIWQVCLNSGVCHAPVPEDLASSDGGESWVTKMTPANDHSYVNYRITLEYSNGNSSTYPETGWGGKVWSDCWVAGLESGGDGCDDDSDGLPGLTTIATISVLGMMAIAVRRLNN